MDEIAARERAKYERVWASGSYGGLAPGAAAAAEVLARWRWAPGQTVIDYGSGSCRAMKVFRQHGLRPIGVDIATNAMPEGMPFTVVPAALWDLPEELAPADWCFCCDVLEHLPEDKIDAALAGMAARTRSGGYIQPALQPDHAGPRLIGAPLHLTVRPAEWWIETIGRHFEVEDAGRARNGFQAKLYIRPRCT